MTSFKTAKTFLYHILFLRLQIYRIQNKILEFNKQYDHIFYFLLLQQSIESILFCLSVHIGVGFFHFLFPSNLYFKQFILLCLHLRQIMQQPSTLPLYTFILNSLCWMVEGLIEHTIIHLNWCLPKVNWFYQFRKKYIIDILMMQKLNIVFPFYSNNHSINS